MNIPFMRRFDKGLGVSAIKAMSMFSKDKDLPRNPKRILIIKLFGFGNFIFLSPVFYSLKKLFPKASIEVLTFAQNREICEMYGLKVHTIRFKLRYLLTDIMMFALRNRNKFDLAFDYEQFVRLSAIIGKLCAPKYYVGLCTPNSGKASAFDLSIEYNEEGHVVEEFYLPIKQVVGMLGKQVNDYPVLIAPRFAYTQKVKDLLRPTLDYKVIGVCPGGRADDEERRYPKKMFAEALDKVLKMKNVIIVFVGSEQEQKDICEIIEMMKTKDRTIIAAGLSLPESAAVISKCDLFISNDTGPIHLAASLGVFCIGLYGPSKEWVYGPYTEKKTILRDKHKPVRSNHNEKDTSWPGKWWPEPDKIYKAVLSQLS